jgi:hypothetical protein
MSTPTDEISVDIDAADAEAARKAAEKAKSGANGTDIPEISVETAPPEPAKPPKAELSPTEGIAKLQKQLDEEKAARRAAETRADEAAHGEAEARGKVQKTELDLVVSAIDRITQLSDALETKYAEAASVGDWAAAAKAQREMAKNAADLSRLEAAKVSIEKSPKPTPRPASDPVEKYAADLEGQWPNSARWVRAHPEFIRDGLKHQQMIAAHQLATARGLKADSPEYFTSIEKTLDITPVVVRTDAPDPTGADDPMAAGAQPVNGGRQAAPAAPVSRSSSGNGGGSRPNVVKLTPAEVEIAGNMGMTVEEYARNKVALKKEGKLS